MSRDLIYLNKAIKAHTEGNLKEAKFFYLKAIEINPNNSKALGWLGTIEAQNKNFCQAEKLLLKALVKEKNNSDFLLNYANILFEIRKYDDAIAKQQISAENFRLSQQKERNDYQKTREENIKRGEINILGLKRI